MTTLRKLFAAILLALVLSVPTLAACGDMGFPPCPSAPTGSSITDSVSGDIDFRPEAGDTQGPGIAVEVLLSALSIF
jgi:predicted small lipoprotein YifL